MASTIITKYGSGAPLASDLVRGELAVDTELGRLYTEDSGGSVVEIGTNPTTLAVDTDTLVVDAANNRVGIGEASPDTLLHLTGSDPKLTFEDSGAYVADSVTSSIVFAGKDAAGSNRGLAFIEAKQHAGANGTGSLDFRTRIAGVEASRLTIDSSGNVGIGASSLGYRLTVQESSASGGSADVLHLYNGAGSTSTVGMVFSTGANNITSRISNKTTNTDEAQLVFETNNGSGLAERMRIYSTGSVQISTVGAQLYFQNSSGPAPYIVNAGTNNSDLTIATGGSERMRIDSSGNLLVGTTSASSTDDGFRVFPTGSGTGTLTNAYNAGGGTALLTGRNTDGTVVDIYRGTTQVGSISVTSSATAYNTSSDYRLKENVVAMSGATERLKQLKPSRFNFIADPETTVDGFLAHEVQDIVPEAITGTKDAVDAEGNPEYQGIDQSKLVPLLVATIQELEARIAALEGAN